MKEAWESLTNVLEEKSVVRDFEEKSMVDKQKTLNRAIWVKKFNYFIDSKTD